MPLISGMFHPIQEILDSLKCSYSGHHLPAGIKHSDSDLENLMEIKFHHINRK